MVHRLRLVHFVNCYTKIVADLTELDEFLGAFLEATVVAGIMHFFARYYLLPTSVLETTLQIKQTTLLNRDELP